jgi:hypothetical protein
MFNAGGAASLRCSTLGEYATLLWESREYCERRGTARWKTLPRPESPTLP